MTEGNPVAIDDRVFLLDTNVLIAAHRSYYAFDCNTFDMVRALGHNYA